ncbi:MAG TPA: hypothetical protein VM261_37935 [Kofleriaceae bacterium]|nr:hypothetical protein [Kofleriaceae bacterium]
MIAAMGCSTTAGARRTPSRIRRERGADRTNVLDDLARDARHASDKRALITCLRAQDATCATTKRVGSICDLEAVLVGLGAF